LADLAEYEVAEREPTIARYGDMKIVSAPPPSSGGIALSQMYRILSGYELASSTDVQRDHYVVEAMRRAYRDRAVYLGDTDFVDVPVDMLVSAAYAAGQRVSIRGDKATPSDSLAGIESDGSDGRQTTHFSILDADGNRVAATITVNTWYGSGFIPPGTGVILNNEMDDFSIKPGVPNEFDLIGDEANSIAPGKRPLSSMSPSFLESERGVAIVGTPGGSRIITMVLLASLAWQDGASAADMVSMKRFHHQYLPDVINYEPGAFTEAEIAQLEAMGHKMSVSRRPFGNMNIVTWDYENNVVEAATDPRGEGEGRVY
jgi:gamma-glutamyltranspeptidase/glutathione hydrolase